LKYPAVADEFHAQKGEAIYTLHGIFICFVCSHDTPSAAVTPDRDQVRQYVHRGSSFSESCPAACKSVRLRSVPALHVKEKVPCNAVVHIRARCRMVLSWNSFGRSPWRVESPLDTQTNFGPFDRAYVENRCYQW